MKKTMIQFEDGTKAWYFGNISHVVLKQGDKIDWSKVVATATVDEHEEYPENICLQY